MGNKPETETTLLTVGVKRATAMSGLSARGIWEQIKAGKLKTMRVGRRRLIQVDSLRVFLGLKN
jgi:hypothetical protein